MLLLGEQQDQTGWFGVSSKKKKIEKLASDQHKYQQKIAVLEEDLEELTRTRAKVSKQMKFVSRGSAYIDRILGWKSRC